MTVRTVILRSAGPGGAGSAPSEARYSSVSPSRSGRCQLPRNPRTRCLTATPETCLPVSATGVASNTDAPAPMLARALATAPGPVPTLATSTSRSHIDVIYLYVADSILRSIPLDGPNARQARRPSVRSGALAAPQRHRHGTPKPVVCFATGHGNDVATVRGEFGANLPVRPMATSREHRRATADEDGEPSSTWQSVSKRGPAHPPSATDHESSLPPLYILLECSACVEMTGGL